MFLIQRNGSSPLQSYREMFLISTIHRFHYFKYYLYIKNNFRWAKGLKLVSHLMYIVHLFFIRNMFCSKKLFLQILISYFWIDFYGIFVKATWNIVLLAAENNNKKWKCSLLPSIFMFEAGNISLSPEKSVS